MNSLTKEERQNQQLRAMLPPAQERLKKYTPEEICKKAAASFDRDRQEFCFESLGQEVRISYPDFVIDPPLSMWHTLTLLQYLDTADGSELPEGLISLTDMPGGMARGAGFNKDIETMFARYFSDTTSEGFAAACRALGAEIVPAKADVCAVFSYAPRFPVTINFWEADDEFPASGKALVNAGAEHYLAIEAAGGACSAVVQAIRDQLAKKTR
ncbi:MAG: DUF3786 domain-containing protein [Blautia sp.]|nr:DUF3786 domain-containing protein [Blautia sp.]